MTIPKFRAWHKIHKKMWDVLEISFFHEEVTIDDGIDWRYFGFTDIELMQFIGHDDKMNEIYENDIIDLYGSKIIAKVNWEILQELDCSIKLGNIFEHPELLNQNKLA